MDFNNYGKVYDWQYENEYGLTREDKDLIALIQKQKEERYAEIERIASVKSTFTLFFCGTGSKSSDSANPDYHSGEIVSTLATMHQGSPYIDYLQVDGPGSGENQKEEKWVNR